MGSLISLISLKNKDYFNFFYYYENSKLKNKRYPNWTKFAFVTDYGALCNRKL